MSKAEWVRANDIEGMISIHAVVAIDKSFHAASNNTKFKTDIQPYTQKTSTRGPLHTIGDNKGDPISTVNRDRRMLYVSDYVDGKGSVSGWIPSDYVWVLNQD